MGAHFVDVAKVALEFAGQRKQSSEVLAGFFQVLKKSKRCCRKAKPDRPC